MFFITNRVLQAGALPVSLRVKYHSECCTGLPADPARLCLSRAYSKRRLRGFAATAFVNPEWLMQRTGSGPVHHRAGATRRLERERKVQLRVRGTHGTITLLEIFLVSLGCRSLKIHFRPRSRSGAEWRGATCNPGLFARVKSCCGRVKPDVPLIPYQIFTDSCRASI